MCHHLPTTDLAELSEAERAGLLDGHDRAELEATFSPEEVERLEAEA